MSRLITWIYQSEEYSEQAAEAFEQRLTERYAKAAVTVGFDFRVIGAGELIPSCLGGPVLRYRGEDLLSDRQCFIVEDKAMTAQGRETMRAVYRTIHASDSVLLNRSIAGPDFLERDKLAMLQHAAVQGVPVPPTLAIPPGRFARRVLGEVAAELGPGPYIIKPRSLSGGIGVLLAEPGDQLSSAIDIVSQADTAYIIQPFVPHEGDMRVYVAGGEVICSLTRRPRPGGYRASISQGGSFEVNDDHQQVAESCLLLARSLGADFICIDWLMRGSRGGPVLVEWSTAHAGFGRLPEPELSQVISAFFGWISRTFDAGE